MLYEKNVETKHGTGMFSEFGWHLRRPSLSSVWRWQERIVEVPQAMGVEVAVQVPKAHLPNSSRFCAAKHRKKTIAARCTSENSKQLKIWYLLQSKSVLLFCWKYWIFNVPFCRTFVHFLRYNMPKSPRNFPKSSWSHGRWSLCLKDREKISYKDEETYYKLCTADSVPVKVLWFARYGWQTNSELKNCNVMYDEVNLLKRLRLFSWLQILKSPMWHWDNGFWYIMKMKKMKMQRCNVTMSPLGSCDFSGCRGASAIERRTSDGGATGAIRSPCVMLRETLMRTPQGFDCGI